LYATDTSRIKILCKSKKVYVGKIKMSYFLNVVLPSTTLLKKPSYNIAEVLELLGISKSTLYRKIAHGQLTFTKDKRIYLKELENYFADCDEKDTP
jgi:excisionase family DNA binding protein